MTKEKYTTMPIRCPSCSNILKAVRLACDECDTTVEGNYDLSLLTQLNPDDQEFILLFIKSSGSLKDIATKYGISYPTMRNRLDSIIERINKLERRSNKENGHGNSTQLS